MNLPDILSEWAHGEIMLKGQNDGATLHFEHDDLVVGGVIGPGSANADDSIARAQSVLSAAPVEDESAELVAAGEVGPRKRRDAPEKGHGAGRLGVMGQGQSRGGVAMLGEHRAVRRMGGDHQEGGVQAPRDQAGGLDDALGDRLDPAGPCHCRGSPRTATGGHRRRASSRPTRSRARRRETRRTAASRPRRRSGSSWRPIRPGIDRSPSRPRASRRRCRRARR